ncbi:MAG: TetR/AcrR family transcriptional regulator [Pseudomonadota bacterium]|nr:TetR/AcrR family transcriptional regulator [Pseudomonadota bacterium]
MAARVVMSVGYEQCNLQDIANLVNLNRPARYHYFSTKQEIFTAIAFQSMRGMYQFVSKEIEKENHPVAKLRSFFASHARYFENNFWLVSATIVGYGGVARRDIGELEFFRNA